MPEYSCEKCSYTTTHKGDFTKHINKKIPCDNNIKYKNKTKNEKIENTDLQNETELLKLEIEKLKLQNQHVQPTISQQPTIIIQQEKHTKKQTSEQKIERFFNNAITMNELIDRFNPTHNELYNTFSCTPDDSAETIEKEFCNGLSKLLCKEIKKLEEEERPIFCSALSRRTLHLKVYKKKMDYEKIYYDTFDDLLDAMDEDDSIENFGERDDDTRKYVGYKSITIEDRENTEWIKETNEYETLTTLLFLFHKKMLKLINKDMIGRSDNYTYFIRSITTSIKENIKKIVSNICKSIYDEKYNCDDD